MKERTWSALLGKALLTGLFLTACTPVQLPQPDPLKNEVIILQKQLLELQKLQLENKTKLDESTSAIDMLSVKMKTLEERQNGTSATKAGARPASSRLHQEATSAKKKPANRRAGKKRKKSRRQE